jgi:hypothetical protein
MKALANPQRVDCIKHATVFFEEWLDGTQTT